MAHLALELPPRAAVCDGSEPFPKRSKLLSNALLEGERRVRTRPCQRSTIRTTSGPPVAGSAKPLDAKPLEESLLTLGKQGLRV